MRNETRLLFNAYVSQIALLNGVDSATVKFSVAPAVEQKLEEKIQESSDFLGMINVVGVPAQQGEKVGVTVTRPLASRTNTAGGQRRTPGDPTDTTDEGGYHCRQTNFDHAIRYTKLDAWRHKPEFQTLLRDVILKQQGRDRIMIGFNGSSVAAQTDRNANPLLQDVNEGWLHKIRTRAASRVLDDGELTDADTKAIYVPEYKSWIEGVLCADAGVGTGTAADVVPTCMVWMLDVGDYMQGLRLGEFLLRHKVPMPSRYARDVATVIVEMIADAAAKVQNAGDAFEAAVLDTADNLTIGIDIHDPVRAKLLKAIGIEQLRQAEEAEADSCKDALVSALVNLREAQRLNDRIGVRDRIKRADKLLAAVNAAADPTDTGGAPAA